MENIETIHDRIKHLVNTFGNGKNTVFASFIGSNEANVRGYTKNIMPKFDFLEKIARNIEINLDWLLTGRGSMLREDPSAAQTPESTISPVNTGEAAVYYKMYKEEKEEVKAQAQEIGQLKERLRQLEGELVSTEKFQPKTSTRSGKIATSGAVGLGGAQFAE